MIFCDRNDWARERHTLHPVINQALEWIAATDFAALEPGKFDILPDNKMFCLYQTMATEPASARRAESHFNYVDIQYLLSGEESIGVARTQAMWSSKTTPNSAISCSTIRPTMNR